MDLDVNTLCSDEQPAKRLNRMGRKRDKRPPPKFNPEDPEDLNDWGAELEQMTKRRRDHNERHQPKK